MRRPPARSLLAHAAAVGHHHGVNYLSRQQQTLSCPSWGESVMGARLRGGHSPGNERQVTERVTVTVVLVMFEKPVFDLV